MKIYTLVFYEVNEDEAISIESINGPFVSVEKINAFRKVFGHVKNSILRNGFVNEFIDEFSDYLMKKFEMLSLDYYDDESSDHEKFEMLIAACKIDLLDEAFISVIESIIDWYEFMIRKRNRIFAYKIEENASCCFWEDAVNANKICVNNLPLNTFSVKKYEGSGNLFLLAKEGGVKYKVSENAGLNASFDFEKNCWLVGTDKVFFE